MAKADPFIAFGKGSGFNDCYGRVSQMDSNPLWTTFSGVNYLNPRASQADIDESIYIAAQMNWNFHYFGFSCSQVVKTEKPPNPNPDPQNAVWVPSGTARTSLSDFDSDGTPQGKQPKDRACGGQWPNGFLFTDDDQDPPGQFIPYQARSSSRIATGPIKIQGMTYNGKFVGFGAGVNLMNVFNKVGFGDSCGVRLSGWARTSIAHLGENYNESLVTIPNNIGKSIHLVCQARSSTGSPNAGNRTSSVSSDVDRSGSVNGSASANYLGFYTY